MMATVMPADAATVEILPLVLEMATDVVSEPMDLRQRLSV